MALEHNGKSFTNADAYRTAKATSAPMAKQPNAAQAAAADKSDPPVMTHHNPDGTHKTVHASGAEHDHANLEALKQHLDQFLSEEGAEGGGEDEAGPWDKE